MQKEIILVKYGEIILRGLNRPIFERLLINNIRNALKNVANADIEIAQATIYITPENISDTDIITDRLTKSCYFLVYLRIRLTCSASVSTVYAISSIVFSCEKLKRKALSIPS